MPVTVVVTGLCVCALCCCCIVTVAVIVDVTFVLTPVAVVDYDGYVML